MTKKPPPERVVRPEVSKEIKRTRVASPMIPMALPDPKLIDLPYQDFSRLAIDEVYQRIKITDWVDQLVAMIVAEGDTPPLVLNERLGDRMWYIVDGQQRYWAHVQTQTGTKALLYRLTAVADKAVNQEEERKLYNILNYHRVITGDNVVKAWPGPTGDIIRKWASMAGSPYHGTVAFDKSRSSGKYSAATLARAICAVVTPQPSIALGGLRRLLAQADADMKLPGGDKRVDALMRLIALVFPPRVKLHMRVAVIFGQVAQRRWHDGVDGRFPSPASQNRLRAVNWDSLVPSTEPKYDIVITKAIENRWK